MAEDPYRYFRVEARELVDALARDLLELERREGGEALGRCFRSAHTLKGAARVVRQVEIGELAHTIEDVLAPYRAEGGAIPGDHARELSALVDRIRDALALLDAPPPSARAAGAPAPAETVRVPLDELDALAEDAVEAEARLLGMRDGLAALAQAGAIAARLAEEGGALAIPAARALLDDLRGELGRARTGIGEGVGRLEGDLQQVHTRARALRLVPASVILAPVETAAREAAAELGKPLDLEIDAGDVRLDGHVLAVLRDALVHLVRNAVDHGLEGPEGRAASGKPPVGQVRLRVERRGSRVAFVCSDDGPGIDVAAVRLAAERGGLVTADEATRAGDHVARDWIFQPGLSTRESVTRLSGRGVGLDVVRETAARLRGDVRVESAPGQGTTFEIIVPVSLSSLTALRVEAAGIAALVPLDAAVGATLLPEGAVVRGAEGCAVLYEDRLVPYAPLVELLGGRVEAARAPRAAVIVEVGGRRAAIGVGRVIDTASVVVRPLPAAAGPVTLIAGATFDAHGDPVLVLDPASVCDAVHAATPGAPIALPARPPPVLIVDDSLTTRMLEQSILEAEGYEIELAASGEEGLRRAAARRHGLYIVDVEMPGMSGLEFVARVRADPALRGTPSILVTSLASPEDRRRGVEAGADAYIVKGEFDQRLLLRTVAGLMGHDARTRP